MRSESKKSKADTFEQRLHDRVHASRRAMEPFQRVRRRIIRQVAGNEYGSGNHRREETAVNLLNQFETTVSREMASNRPKASITSKWSGLKPTAAKLEVLVNHYIDRMGYARKLQSVARSSLWGIGAIWQGLENLDSVEIAPGEFYTPTEVACRLIHYSDLIIDMEAGDWDELEFIGHVFRMPLEAARKEPSFDKEARKKMLSTRDSQSSETSRDDDNIAFDQSMRKDALVDEVELINLYLPQTQETVTMLSGGETMGPDSLLRRVPYEGPERQLGEYHLLYHDMIDDSVHPVPPMFNLLGLHEFSNRMFRKIARKSDREKDILLFTGGTDADSNRIVTSGDGDAISVGQATNFNPVSFGGPTQGSVTAWTLARENFNRQAGNIDLVGGLGPQSETLGQDTLLTQSANKTISYYQENMVEFTRGLIESLAWYLWDDPVLEQKLAMEVPETGDELPFTWTPESRIGDFSDYAFSVEPYSLPHMPPGARAAGITQLLNTVIMPLLPAMQQEGVSLDVDRLLRTLGKYTGLTEINDIVRFSGIDPESRATGDGPGMPANTTRTEIRKGAGGTTAQGLERVLAQGMGGGGDDGGMTVGGMG